MDHIKHYAMALALIGMSGSAVATDCSSIMHSYSMCSDDVCRALLIDHNPECFSTTNEASSNLQISGTTVQQILSISSAVSTSLSRLAAEAPWVVGKSGGRGMAAGEQAKAWNVWGNLANTDSQYEKTGNTATRSSGEVLNAILGVDYRFNPTMVIGVSGAFDRGRGSMGTANTGTTTKGYNIAPYFGAQLSPNLSLEASAGFGEGNFSAAATDADSHRSFYALNLSYTRWLGNVQLVGKGGYLAAREKYGDTRTNGVINVNSASSNKLEQLRLGGEVGYWMNGFMPYFGLMYTDDLSRATAVNTLDWDRDAFALTLGVNFFSLKKGVTGGIQYSQETSRRNNDNNCLTANVNMRF